MAKLFHFKSDHDRERIGDVIVNLDKVLTIRAYEKEGQFCIIMDYTREDQIRAWFKDKEKFLSEFKRLVNEIGGDISIVDDYVLMPIPNRIDLSEAADILKSLKEKLESF